MTLGERLCTELLTSKTRQTPIKPSSGAHIYTDRETGGQTKFLTSKTHSSPIKPPSQVPTFMCTGK